MGVLFQTGVHAELESSCHGAMNYGQTRRAIRTVPKLSDRLQSRFVGIVQAIDWLVHLLHQFVDGMQLRCFVIYGGVGITPS